MDDNKIKLKFGLISLGSISSKMILDEAAKIFDSADLIDLRKILSSDQTIDANSFHQQALEGATKD